MSTKSSLLAQRGPRVRTRAVDRVQGGSSERLTLKPKADFDATVSVARSLIRRGVSASVARHVVERLVGGHAASVTAPHYDGRIFDEELAAAGIDVGRPPPLDGGSLAAMRHRLALSQEQFANSVGLQVRTLQNWEQKRSFDAPTELLIRVIERFPEMVQEVAADGARIEDP